MYHRALESLKQKLQDGVPLPDAILAVHAEERARKSTGNA